MLPLLLFNKIFGCPADIGDALTGAMGAFFDGIDVQRANDELTAGLMELISIKRRNPAADVTSWLIQHPAGLTDEELKDQLIILMGAGFEPLRNLIGHALHLLLSAEGSGGSGMLVEEAIDHVLWHNPPIANYATHFPVQDVDLGGLVVEANSPVVISFAGANSDPALKEARENRNKGAHLAWGAGPHACPAKDPALVVAIAAIERILNALPDLALAVPDEQLQWRPGPFQHALAALPVRFSPTPASRMVSALRTAASPPAPEQPVVPTGAEPVPQPQPTQKRGFWSTLVDLFRV
jgi:cytochrome P450